jgi:hypothetical protein
MELVGLAACAFTTLALWWLWPGPPDSSFAATSAAMFGLQPLTYRLLQTESSGRPIAVALALLTWGVVALLGGLTLAWILPASIDQHVDLVTGFIVGMPAGAAVFSWSLNRGERCLMRH